MHRFVACLCLFASLFVSSAYALDLNSTYYDIYEKPGPNNQTIIYIVPKPSVLILASEPITPITFMPQIPGFSAIVGADGSFGSLTQNAYNSNDMVGLGAAKSTYKLFGGDFNGDGKADFLLQGSGSRASIAIVTDYATGQAAVYYSFGAVLNGTSLTVVDVDGNGRSDVIAGSVTYLASGYGAWFDSSDRLAGLSINYIGTSAGKFNVDRLGNATYSLNILTVGGSGGVSPHLSLNYSSAGGDGIAGPGWSLNASSSITRCRATLAVDNTVSAVTLGVGDKFCVNGQRLVVVSGSYGAVGAVYRKEIDDYSVYTSFGGGVGNPAYFTERGKDGSLRYYGNGNGSQLVFGSSVYRWAVSRMEDRVGNPIRYSYSTNATTNEQLLSRIDYAYGGDFSATGSSTTFIKFDYENRPDATSSFIAGYRIQNTQRLAVITSYGSGTELRNYTLTYQVASEQQSRSYLSQIFECVGRNCITPTNFQWSLNKGGFSAGTEAFTTSGALRALRTLDANGDGKSDIVYMTSATANNETTYSLLYRQSIGSGYAGAQALAAGSITDGNTNWQILDYNNDSRQDLLLGNPNGSWKIFYGTVNGLSTNGVDLGIAYTPWATTLDLNSDGLADLVEQGVGQSFTYRFLQPAAGNVYQFGSVNGAEISAIEQQPPTCVPTPGVIYPHFGFQVRWPTLRIGSATDINGDGRADVVGQHTYGNGCGSTTATVAYSNRDAVLNSAQWTKTFLQYPADNTPIYADFNRDGLTDFVTVSYSESWKLQLSTGTGFVLSADLGMITAHQAQPFPSDYNGDGYPDLLYPTGNALVVRMFSPATQSFAAPISTGIAFQPADTTYAGDLYMPTDSDGDGQNDLIKVTSTLNDARVMLYKSQDVTRVDNRITAIDHGYGKRTAVTYKPLTDAAVYTRAYDASNSSLWPGAPVLDVISGNYVVASVTTTSPSATGTAGAVNQSSLRSFSYTYAGLKLQASGRGMLGFASQTVTDLDSRIATTTTYRQNFPFVGYAIATTVTTSADNLEYANRLLKRTDRNAAAITRTAADGTKYYQVYTDKVTEYAYELTSGAEVARVETTNGAPDEWGNVSSVAETTYVPGSTSMLRQRVTSNSYGSSAFDKQFGRLSAATVTYKRAGQVDRSRASQFTYYTTGTLQGLLKEEIIEPGSALQQITEYQYDSFGNRARVTKKGAAGMADRYTAISYDTSGRFPIATKSEFCSAYSAGSSICSTWTEQATEQVISRNAFGQPTQVAGLNGIVTNFQYDPLGRESKRWDNAGAQVTTSYSRGGSVAGSQYQVVAQTNTGGYVTESFDLLGRSIGKANTAFDGRTVISETEYDILGRVKRQAQPHFSGYTTYWTTNTYDAVGRLKQQSVPAADGSTATSGFGYASSSGAYIAETTVTNALNQQRVERRNAAGELVKAIDHIGGEIEYDYDVFGQLTETRTTGSGTTITTKVAYDDLGRKSKMVDQNKGTWFYNYDVFNELTDQYKVTSATQYAGSLSDALSSGGTVTLQRTHMDYDRRGRLIARADYEENGVVEGTASWIYDTASSGIGLLKSESGGGLTRTFSYDSLGRPSAAMHTDDAGSYLLSTTYDSYGRPLEQTDAVSTASGTRNSYNSYGYLQSIADLQSNTVLYQTQATDAFGNATTALLGNGGTSTWSYNPGTGHLLNQKAVVGMYTFVDLTYTWDALGNQVSRQDKGLVSTSTNSYRNLTQNFCYDGLNRLIKTATNAAINCGGLNTASQDQQYDALGNVTYKTDVGGYTYGDAARPLTLTAAGGISYTYDKTGNLISDTSGRALTYSVFDKPLTITKASDQVSFAYGPDRQYYKRTDVKGGVTTRTYHIGDVEKVVKADGSYDFKRSIAGIAIWTHKFNSANIQTALDKQFIYKDVLGSVVLITDGVGGMKGQMAFGPWGSRVSYNDWVADQSATYAGLQVSTLFTTDGYTGHDMLDALGLIHMKGRIYDAKIARFVQADPYVPNAKSVQSFNRFAYVINNPLTNVDPDGYHYVGPDGAEYEMEEYEVEGYGGGHEGHDYYYGGGGGGYGLGFEGDDSDNSSDNSDHSDTPPAAEEMLVEAPRPKAPDMQANLTVFSLGQYYAPGVIYVGDTPSSDGRILPEFDVVGRRDEKANAQNHLYASDVIILAAQTPVLGSGIEAHNGGKEHVHWGSKSDPRANAVNKDGSVRHGKNPPRSIKTKINEKFNWDLKMPLIIVPFSPQEMDQIINPMPEDVREYLETCGYVGCWS